MKVARPWRLRKKSQKKHFTSEGMALIEMIVASAIAAAFLASVVAVLQVTSIYLASQNDVDPTRDGQGSVVEREYLDNAIDNLVSVLDQPGLSEARIQKLLPSNSGNGCIASAVLRASGSSDARQDLSLWLGATATDLKLDLGELPIGYSFCLRALDPEPTDLSRGGLYVLYAVPDGGISLTRQPLHRIFCRPRPLCS